MSGLVAITGGSGFVGSRTVDALVDAGYEVRALVRDAAKVRFGEGVDIVSGDLTDHTALDRLCDGAVCVVHCAGVISAATREGYDTVNVAGTRNLLDAALRSGAGRLILISSLAAREPGLSDYGASKRAGETIVREAGEGLSWAILRPPAVYGPGDRGTLPLIKQLTQRIAIIPGSKKSRFSLVFVDDLASGIVSLVNETAAASEIFELDDGAIGGHSWAELAAMAGQSSDRSVRCIFLPRTLAMIVATIAAGFSRLTGKTPEISPGKVRELYHDDWVCANNLLGRFAHWAPTRDFRSGFTETVGWYRTHGWL